MTFVLNQINYTKPSRKWGDEEIARQGDKI
jgi:hypothetical protein